MFLDLLRRRNPALIDAAIVLHQQGELPANTYVFDLDAVTANAAAIAAEASRLGLTPLAMTKQFGRNPDVCRAVLAGGIEASVAVDMACARATTRAGMRLGHLGHLVQVPAAEAGEAAALAPDHWTVFSHEKARGAAAAAAAIGGDQAFLARIHDPADQFYPGHEGGFPAAEIRAVADALNSFDGGHFAGITTFPALLFDQRSAAVVPTHNLATLERAAAELAAAGYGDVHVNAPGTTSAATLARLADSGATHVEPGHGLTGTTPLHARHDLVELPAGCYLSEVSHVYGGRAYCFGGGMYVDPVFPDYDVRAVVGRAPEATDLVPAELPPPQAIDYYGQLDLTSRPGGAGRTVDAGDSVVFGFRFQAFVTRAYTAGVTGVSSGRPRVAGLWSADGTPTWSPDPAGGKGAHQ
ncbi:alanine racemase [Phytoactinopolyspora limicola]|uniref:alanine racemase n=1 Tax=Phytoactinopolyspora limicola TaxID=2715536 RepID=UPI00140A1BF0|nr:alanine racemase [Phytoactinopolyspora limicola]